MDTVERILGSELYGKVQDKLGNDKGLIIDDGMLIPKHRFDCINLSHKEHKKLAGELKEENARLKARLERLDEIERELAELKTERSILEIILQAKPKNYQAVRSLIKIDGQAGRKLAVAVEKQLEQIKSSEPYLFYGCDQTYRLVPVTAEEFKHE